MSNTYVAISDSVTSIINAMMLPRVLEYVKAHKNPANITIDELINHLGTRVTASVIPSPSMSPAIGNPSGAIPRQVKVAVAPVPQATGNGCIYQFRRGVQKNELCCAQVYAEGYCRSHYNKYGSGAQNKAKATSAPVNNFPFPAAQGGRPPVPNGIPSHAVPQPQPQQEEVNLDCTKYKLNEDYVREKEYGFIIDGNSDPDNLLTFGRAETDTSPIVDLTPADIELAGRMQLKVVPNPIKTTVNTSTTPKSTPKVTVPTIPMIPNVAVAP